MNLPLNQSQPAAAASAQPTVAILLQPEKKKRRKKGKKENFISKLVGKVALGSAEAFTKMGDALTGAGEKYARKHRKSNDKRRKGWRKDLGKNLAAAAADLITDTAKAPARFIKVVVKKDKKKKKKDREVRTVLMQPLEQSTAGAT